MAIFCDNSNHYLTGIYLHFFSRNNRLLATDEYTSAAARHAEHLPKEERIAVEV